MEDLDNVRGGELLERVSVYNVGVASGPDFPHMSRPDTGHHLTSSLLPPQDSHSEVQIYDLRLCYPPHLTRRAIIASNTNTQRSDQVALI